MKVYEAMLRGYAMVSSQARNKFYDEENNTACAMGCVFLGNLGYVPSLVDYNMYEQEVLDLYESKYFYGIVYDNDVLELPISEIAKKVKAVEDTMTED